MENEQNLELEQEPIEKTGEAPKEPKKELTPEQELGIKRRNFSRLAEELGVEVERPWVKKPEPAKPAEKKEFNDTEHLFLDVKQVPQEDRSWLFEEQKTIGKGIRQVLDFKYVQDHLNEQKQKREAEAGLPDGTRKAGTGSSDSAGAWLSKIESGRAKLSDIPDFSLRSEVVKLRENTDKNANRPNW